MRHDPKKLLATTIGNIKPPATGRDELSIGIQSGPQICIQKGPL